MTYLISFTIALIIGLIAYVLVLRSQLKEAKGDLVIRLGILDLGRSLLDTTTKRLHEEQRANKILRGELAGMAMDEILKSLEDGSELSKFKVH